MKIELNHIKIREIFNGYENNDEKNGVIGYGGKLDIRPKYQREYVYGEKQKKEVVNTITKQFPLNVLYWIKNKDGYEVLDGQQRTISFCSYIAGDFSIDNKYFHSLTKVEQNIILDYELMIYFCEGTDKEKLDWFKIVNIAGEKLTDQELRNSVYTGMWLTEAKKLFSKTGGNAYQIGKDYLKGTPIRQDYLEKTLSWINNNEIEEYMSKHQKDYDANELWQYFNEVLDWVKRIFPIYRKEMKGLEWGEFYNKYKNEKINAEEAEKRITLLFLDDEVEKKSGIYKYILSEDEKYLNLRVFPAKIKSMKYEQQKGICKKCKAHFAQNEMEADHIIPWSKGGQTVQKNCQMLCMPCNRSKSDQ